MIRRLPPLCCLDPFQSQETPYVSLYWWTSVSGAYGHIKGLKTITHFQINWRTVLGTRTQVLHLGVFSPKFTAGNERCCSRQQPVLLRTGMPSVSVALRTTCCSRRDKESTFFLVSCWHRTSWEGGCSVTSPPPSKALTLVRLSLCRWPGSLGQQRKTEAMKRAAPGVSSTPC